MQTMRVEHHNGKILNVNYAKSNYYVELKSSVLP